MSSNEADEIEAQFERWDNKVARQNFLEKMTRKMRNRDQSRS